MCLPQPGKRCTSSVTQRSKNLNSVNKRIRRTTNNLTKEDLSDEQKKKLEEKLKDDYAQKEDLIRNPENTKQSATTKTAEQTKTVERLAEAKAEAEKAKTTEEEDTVDNSNEEHAEVPVKKAAPSSSASPVVEKEPRWDSNGFDKETGMHRTGTEFDPETGLDIDGYDYNMFDADGNHQDTGTRYNDEGLDHFGEDRNGSRDEDFFIPSFSNVNLDDYEVDVDEVELDEEY